MNYADEIWASLPEDRPVDESIALWAAGEVDAPVRSDLLDLGCGDGKAAALIAKAGARVTGVDPSRVALDRARAAYPDITFAEPNRDGTLPFADSHFDAAVCLNVLEHVADTQQLISELRRVLAPGGRVAMAVPSNGWLATMLAGPRAFSRRHDPLEPVLRYYTRRTLRSLLEQFGFDEIAVQRTGGTLRAGARRG